MVAFLSKNAKNGGDQLAPGVPVRAGQIIAGRYRVEELLGCSANAIVVTARHVHLRTPVTLKILTAYTDEQLDLVKREVKKARIASRLRGEHVARILDIGTTEDGDPFIVSERLEGHTLASELASRGRFAPEEALRLGLEICEGLAEAHAVGLVHGDLKTKNLFLAKKQGHDEPVLEILDFGMASPIESTNDASATAWFGMPSYLAPEQIKDPTAIDARADIWALGVILHELISGSLPFVADTVSGVLVAVCCDAAPLLSEVPLPLAKIIHRCLEKDPAERIESVEALAAALAPFLGDEGTRASERIRAALATPALDDDADADPDASHSIPPMSVPVDSARSSHAPVPLVTRRPREEKTVPSQRIANRRRARVRAVALGTVVTATAIAAAAIVTAPPSIPRPGASSLSIDDDVVIPSTREPFSVDPAPRAMHEEVVVSSPHELPAASPPPPARTPAPHPVLRPRAARSGLRLPKWLPGGRDPSVVARPIPAKKRDHDNGPPSSRGSSPPSLPPPRTDDGYMRNLFNERK